MKLILYTGPQCSLCDHAIDIVDQYNAMDSVEFNVNNQKGGDDNSSKILLNKVNIRDSADLYHLYGARIPVLKNPTNNNELAWPFTLDNLIEFLK